MARKDVVISQLICGYICRRKAPKKGGKRKSSNPGPDRDDNSRSNSPKPR